MYGLGPLLTLVGGTSRAPGSTRQESEARETLAMEKMRQQHEPNGTAA